MRDISETLAKLGKPGDNRDKKREAVEKLFQEKNHSPFNIQGISVLDTLDTYGEY